jgi:competence protein ComEC
MSKPKPAVSGERSEISNQQSEISNEKWLPGHSVPVATRPVLDWLKQRYTFRADPAAAVCLVPGQGSRLMAACFQLRRKCAAVLARGIEHRPEVAGLLQALLLGYRQELPEKVRNDFVATGTYHIFAISGQHVAILALFIIVILRAYRVSRVRWFLYVTPILLVFTVATGMSSSAVRGCLMALLCFLGPLIGRKPDIPSAMALAALLILGADPFQLFDYGFLLSFVAVSGLIVLCPPLLQRLAPVMEPDELRLQPEPRLVRWGRRGLRFVVFLSATSLAAWLVTTPLVARWFNLISPIALLANLIVIPVATLVLLAGCLSIVGGLAVPLLGEIFNFANVVLVSFLLWVTDLMARIPYGHVFVKSPPLWSLPIWYGALAGWILWRRKPWVWLAAPVLLALALATGWVGSRVEVEIDLLNCGDHPVCFVNVPGGDDLLIDPGGRYEARRIIRHLRRQGVDRLRAVLLTGGGNARVGGMADILPAVPVGELWLPPGGGKSKSRQSPADLARERGMDLRCWATGKRLFIPPARRMLGAAETNLDFIVLNAGGNDSLAWRLRRGAFSVLFVQGDSASALAALRELDPESRPTVLVENRLEEEFKPPYRERAAAGIGCAWRIICTRRLFAEDGGEASSGERSLRLPPGQGVRLCLERDRLELEHLEY